jgi:hypothetical protein
MDTKTKQIISTGTVAELSLMKAGGAEVLKGDPGRKDAQEIVEAVNAELEKRAKSEPAKVKVRAKNFVTVDGQAFQKDQEGTITARQYGALACNFVKLACLALFGLILAAPSSASAQGQYTLTSIAITNSLAPSYATAGGAAQLTVTGGTNAITKFEECALQYRGVADAADSSTITILLVPSLDGTNFSTQSTETFVWTITMNGTTAVNATTNLPKSWMGSVGYWKIGYITNAHATANVTGSKLLMAVKPNRFGY